MRSPGIQARFDAEVLRLRDEIARHKEAVAGAPNRQWRIDTLTTLLQRLDGLIAVLRDDAGILRPILRRTAMPRLGALLSASGIESLMGPVGWGIDDRAIDDIFQRCGRGDVTSMDGLTQSRRQGLASEMGPQLLARLLQTQRGPMKEALALEKRVPASGRPQHLYRNYVVQELVMAWEDETGSLAPSGKTGPFRDLCTQALGGLGLSKVGLDDCIYRTIRKPLPAASPQNPP